MSEYPEVLDILKQTGGILANGHFVGVSGRHFDTYVLKDALFPYTKESSRIGELFALRNRDLEVDIVAAPSLGGIVLSQWTAFHLSRLKGKEILAVFTEKTPDNQQLLGRGYEKLVLGKKVLVIEDSTTTGGSAAKVAGAVRRFGGEVAAVSVMVNRDPERVTEATFGVSFRPLAELPIVSYAPEECPLCRNTVPVNVEVGHGKKFIELPRPS